MKINRLSKEDKQEIIKLYQEGVPPAQIGKKFGIYSNSVTRIIRKSGLDRNQLARVSPADIQKIIDDYVNKKISSELIGANLGINGSTVCRILKRNNIDIRPGTQNKRKYNIDESFFETIDNEAKAYFLGFLYADGHITTGGNGIHLTLENTDLEILKIFSNFIYNFINIRTYKRKLKDNKTGVYNTLSFYSKKMHSDLINLGCTPKKSFTISFPAGLFNDELYSHFIRGFFDGDGCISITSSENQQGIIDFTSNIIFLSGLIDYLNKTINTNLGPPHQKKDCTTNTGNIQFKRREDVTNFYNFLYKDASYFLERKKNKFSELFVIYNNKDDKKLSKYTDINNYGTTYIPEYENKLLTKEYIQTLNNEEKIKIADSLFLFYRERGFPHIKLNDNDLIKEFTALKNSEIDKIIENKNIKLTNWSGNLIFKHFSPHFYEVKSGRDPYKENVFEAFNNDDSLKKVILNGLNRNENITGRLLKQSLADSKIAYKASIFNPVAAKAIYSKFSKENDIIYDYSMGFGQRLLGALSLPYKVKYIGVDPLEKSVESNKSIFEFYNKNVPLLNKECEIICGGSENFCDEKYHGKVNLAFSSPPYFNLEKYSNDNTQAYSDDNYSNFINQWWKSVVDNIDKLLAPNGIFAINVSEYVSGFNLAEDMMAIMKIQGFELIDTYYLQLTKGTNFNGEKDNPKIEPIFVFKKAPQL